MNIFLCLQKDFSQKIWNDDIMSLWLFPDIDASRQHLVYIIEKKEYTRNEQMLIDID